MGAGILKCQTCNGTGSDDLMPCFECDGTGRKILNACRIAKAITQKENIMTQENTQAERDLKWWKNEMEVARKQRGDCKFPEITISYSEYCLLEKAFNEHCAALAAPQVSVPDGYKLVPIEPTQYQLDSIAVAVMAYANDTKPDSVDEDCPRLCYKAMLSAAPKVPE